MHTAMCDNIDTRRVLETLRELVVGSNAYIEKMRVGEPWVNRQLLKNVATYITRSSSGSLYPGGRPISAFPSVTTVSFLALVSCSHIPLSLRKLDTWLQAGQLRCILVPGKEATQPPSSLDQPWFNFCFLEREVNKGQYGYSVQGFSFCLACNLFIPDFFLEFSLQLEKKRTSQVVGEARLQLGEQARVVFLAVEHSG